MPESLFNKIAGLKSALLLKWRLWHRCFPVNSVKFLRTTFFIERIWWLLLYIDYNVPLIALFPSPYHLDHIEEN